MSDIVKQIDEILESYYKKQIDLLEVRKQFLTLIEENYVSKEERCKCQSDYVMYSELDGKCGTCGKPA